MTREETLRMRGWINDVQESYGEELPLPYAAATDVHTGVVLFWEAGLPSDMDIVNSLVCSALNGHIFTPNTVLGYLPGQFVRTPVQQEQIRDLVVRLAYEEPDGPYSNNVARTFALFHAVTNLGQYEFHTFYLSKYSDHRDGSCVEDMSATLQRRSIMIPEAHADRVDKATQLLVAMGSDLSFQDFDYDVAVSDALGEIRTTELTTPADLDEIHERGEGGEEPPDDFARYPAAAAAGLVSTPQEGQNPPEALANASPEHIEALADAMRESPFMPLPPTPPQIRVLPIRIRGSNGEIDPNACLMAVTDRGLYVPDVNGHLEPFTPSVPPPWTAITDARQEPTQMATPTLWSTQQAEERAITIAGIAVTAGPNRDADSFQPGQTSGLPAGWRGGVNPNARIAPIGEQISPDDYEPTQTRLTSLPGPLREMAAQMDRIQRDVRDVYVELGELAGFRIVQRLHPGRETVWWEIVYQSEDDTTNGGISQTVRDRVGSGRRWNTEAEARGHLRQVMRTWMFGSAYGSPDIASFNVTGAATGRITSQQSLRELHELRQQTLGLSSGTMSIADGLGLAPEAPLYQSLVEAWLHLCRRLPYLVQDEARAVYTGFRQFRQDIHDVLRSQSAETINRAGRDALQRCGRIQVGDFRCLGGENHEDEVIPDPIDENTDAQRLAEALSQRNAIMIDDRGIGPFPGQLRAIDRVMRIPGHEQIEQNYQTMADRQQEARRQRPAQQRDGYTPLAADFRPTTAPTGRQARRIRIRPERFKDDSDQESPPASPDSPRDDGEDGGATGEGQEQGQGPDSPA